jgi:hypothetical protein
MTTRTTPTGEAAKALGMSPQALNRMVTTKGGPCDTMPDGSRRFDLDELQEWYRTHGSVQSRGANKAGAFAKGSTAGAAPVDENTPLGVRVALDREHLRKQRLANDLKEGKLMDAEEAERAWSAQMIAVRQAMDAMPSRLSSKLCAALQIPAEKAGTIAEAVRAEVMDVCRGLSK